MEIGVSLLDDLNIVLLLLTHTVSEHVLIKG